MNFSLAEVIIIIVLTLIALYFIIIKPRKDLLEKLSITSKIVADLKNAKTAKDFLAIRTEMRKHPMYHTFLYYKWAYAVSGRIKEMHEEIKHPKMPSPMLGVLSIMPLFNFLAQINDPLDPVERAVLNKITSKENGVQVMYGNIFD